MLRSVFGFDVLDVLNYLVSYFDNNLYVVGDFLTIINILLLLASICIAQGVRVPNISIYFHQ